MIETLFDLQQNLTKRGWEVRSTAMHMMVYESELPYMFIKYTPALKQELQRDEMDLFTAINGAHQNSFFALTNGTQYDVYSFNFGNVAFLEHVEDITAFLHRSLDEWAFEDIYRRLEDIPFLQQQEIIHNYIENGLISETTALKWQQQFTELINALFYETYEKTRTYSLFQRIKDAGVTYVESKNASGGGYEGLHRKFTMTLNNGQHVDFIVSIFATAMKQNDPVYHNRKGSTQLNVAMLHKRKSTYNLQINLNKYVEEASTHYSIWHDGRRSSFKTAYVVEAVQQYAEFLWQGDRVQLGTFPLNETIDTEAFSTFIENCLAYSYCRYLANEKYR